MLLVPPPWLLGQSWRGEEKSKDIVTEDGGWWSEGNMEREQKQVGKTVTTMMEVDEMMAFL